MNTAGAHESGYATAAIVAALLDTLIRNRIISRADASLERRCYCPERAWQQSQRGGSYSKSSAKSARNLPNIALAKPMISLLTNATFTDEDNALEFLEA